MIVWGKGSISSYYWKEKVIRQAMWGDPIYCWSTNYFRSIVHELEIFSLNIHVSGATNQQIQFKNKNLYMVTRMILFYAGWVIAKDLRENESLLISDRRLFFRATHFHYFSSWVYPCQRNSIRFPLFVGIDMMKNVELLAQGLCFVFEWYSFLFYSHVVI